MFDVPGGGIRTTASARCRRGPRFPGATDRPGLAMVDSDRGITNLHVPSDVIIDASMPAAIRTSGQMWNADGELQDTKFVIPDHSYAPLYAETVDYCREHGAFDPATMGTTPNVGLMAQAAEEYGSHDKTFEITGPGTVRVVDDRRRDAARARGRRRRHLAHVPDQGRADPGLGAARRRARPRDRRAGGLLARRDPRPRRRAAREGAPGARRSSTPTGCRSRSSTSPTATRFTLERARAGRGHDLGHRQRPARLPHRPVPDPRARHEREDAVDRAADERRRPVRDRRRRLGAEARPAVPQGEPPALGLARRVPRAGPVARVAAPTRTATRARRCWRTRSTARPGGCSRRTARRRGGAASWTTAAATSTSRCTGRRSWRRRRDDAELAARFARLAERLAADEQTIVAELDAVQGSPVRHRRLLPSLTPSRWRRRCARARRSTRRSRRSRARRSYSSIPYTSPSLAFR